MEDIHNGHNGLHAQIHANPHLQDSIGCAHAQILPHQMVEEIVHNSHWALVMKLESVAGIFVQV